MRKFLPVGLIYNVPYFVAVSAQSPWQKMSDLIAAPRKAPGRCLMEAPM